MNAHTIIRKPLSSEKGSALNEKLNVYLFEVDRAANKLQIRQAVEQLFGVKVASVRTLLGRGKVVRRGLQSGRKRNFKKAYVQLKEGEKIALFEGV